MSVKKVAVFSHYPSGGGKPLDSFWFSQEACQNNDITLNICWTNLFWQSIRAAFCSSYIIFDGKYSLLHYKAPLLILTALFASKRVGIYWHETEWNLINQWPFDPHARPRIYSFFLHPIYFAIRIPTWILMRSKRVIHFHVCQYGVDLFSHQFEVDRQKIYLLNNISAAHNLQKYELPLLFKKHLFIACGKMSNRKRPDLFVKIAARICGKLPDARFIWIGNFTEFFDIEKLRREIRAKGLLEKVVLLGYQEHPDYMMAQANVIVHTSQDDPMPKVLMDALGLGKYVVAFNVGGIAELLGNLGKVVPFGDVDAYVEAAIDGTNNYDEIAQKKRRQRYLENFTPESFGKRFATAVEWWDNQIND